MRISDWSSDVCSSDLGVQGFVREQAARRRLSLGPRQCDREFLGHDAQALRPSRLPADEHRPRRQRHPCGRGGKAAQGRISRSEEHTSELQSLMRISYALFCLKKKIEIETIINT